MTLRVEIRYTSAAIREDGGRPEIFYTLDDGVLVDGAGELVLVCSRDTVTNRPDEFYIIAPGKWARVDVQKEDE